MLKKFMVLTLVIMTAFSAGCGELKRSKTKEVIVNQTLWRDLFGMRKTKEVFADNHKNIMQPAFKLADDFYAEISKIPIDDQDEFYAEQARIIESKYLPKAIKLQEAIAKEEIMRMNDGVMFYGKRQIDEFVKRLENALKVSKPNTNDKQKLIDDIRKFDKTRYKENFYGYNYEWTVLSTGKVPEVVSKAKFHLIKKGQSYEQILDLLKMPGRFLVGNTVVNKQNEQEWHQPVIWVQGDSYIYVEFINNQAANLQLWPYDGWKSPRN